MHFCVHGIGIALYITQSVKQKFIAKVVNETKVTMKQTTQSLIHKGFQRGMQLALYINQEEQKMFKKFEKKRELVTQRICADIRDCPTKDFGCMEHKVLAYKDLTWVWDHPCYSDSIWFQGIRFYNLETEEFYPYLNIDYVIKVINNYEK